MKGIHSARGKPGKTCIVGIFCTNHKVEKDQRMVKTVPSLLTKLFFSPVERNDFGIDFEYNAAVGQLLPL